MKIVITGGAGLIGSHLVDELLKNNEVTEILIFDDLSFGKYENLKYAFKDERVRFELRDILVDNIYTDVFKMRPDIIIHCASLKKSFVNSLPSSAVLWENIQMTLTTARLSQQVGSKFLFFSTSDIYNNSETFSENESLFLGTTDNPRYSYALSKVVGEQYVLNLVNEKQLHANIVRIFGCTSPRANKSWSGGHVPLFIDKAIKGEKITIHGDGLQTRAISHASDIAKGVATLVSKFDDYNGEVFNLGTSEETTVKYVAEKAIELTNSTSEIEYIPTEKIFGNYREINRRWANTEKAQRELGFKITYSTEQVIQEIINA